ncbi:hypothetical protein AUEXF2481DRAFT_26957 [Aureobasidium subglaciale EXF-2481]|uniref:X-Pro dipeptidyl-peptidase n=1 Tax=Aureobasidium subglaciale (strain EXF-2481) TaxID=1043005 RepID=A0A074YLN0_AURSE|nr:uncharacterized protein AUEXF2481DRAFT_26957 [Aureobasidium subglaciale EXF-2481]KAI5198889.1 hypothetical protein E4T38_07289 [Aureobasidium subglaciale]KAI5217629.1 hypothetical protein E4T40_07300 [Aureobasidium subglaciale]KAI5221228.1 hypothetical protein E4T41_07141 [Aureobasidium subglaciale]KAI5258956.1 hypothetical protein E4T46_07118 [Aureobasidium subglaciale]KEQ98595.1 hypothetical protein AUEXF2481DRAFT_26957 [Aureobasidium subglaciale EXF-2481]
MRVRLPIASARRARPGVVSAMIECVTADVSDIEQFYNCNFSKTRTQRLKDYFRDKLVELKALEFDQLDLEDQIDFVLLEKYLRQQLGGLESFETSLEELKPILEPFASELVDLIERRQKVVPTTGKYAAEILSSVSNDVQKKSRDIESDQLRINGKGARFAAYRAANNLDELQYLLSEWMHFYKGYDPTFTWWTIAPCEEAQKQLQNLATAVRAKLVGATGSSTSDIVGQPVGRDGLLASLDAQFIAYSPEELMEIADKEYAWCESEMIKASKTLGYGKDWKAALEHVKNLYVEPGQQTYLVHELSEEAVAYVKKHDMVTVPPIAEECWRTFMMTPARQKVNPFFLGGDDLIVSYPTDTMSHADKLMSLRGNNRPMSRSTVFHELIPGHHLQMYMIARFRSYRSLFTTPFWIEGWALYWEFVLWDRGFASTPEEKIGMLFWRMHRCARIVFSLKFHLNQMTPQECIDYLVEKVGHERATAEGEVRRSFNGDYPPLYQAGYMLGALQIYAMRKEMVEGAGMAEKDFHDRILKEGEMPIEILRALLQERKLQPGYKAGWKFYDL